MKKRNVGYSIFAILLVLIASFGIYQYTQAKHYQIMMNNQYQRSFGELVDYVGNIETDLKKGKAVTDTSQMTVLASEIWRKASFAQANLGQLPISDIELEHTSNFLAQVGDYTYSLSRKMLDGEEITVEEKQQMKELGDYATSLSEALNGVQQDLYSGKISFAKAGNKVFAKEGPGFNGGMESVEKEFADYPSLIYDGPFSEHINQMKPLFLEGKPEISAADAEQRVRDFLSNEQITSITALEDGNGVIPTYCFNVETDQKDMGFNIAITKQGGYPVWMLSNKPVYSQELSQEEGVEKVKQFLSDQNYLSMKESYFEQSGNTLMCNFSFEQDGVIIYTDLIKVKVSLEDGSIIGFESHGYLMNHRDVRDLPQVALSAEEANRITADVMEIESQNLCMIPLETKKEVLCYEFKGKIDEDEYLIYLNAQTGKQEKIMLLLVSESGTLTL